MIERRWATIAVALALGCASLSVARAEEGPQGLRPQTLFELRGGSNTPVGVVGTGLALRFRERLDLTLGVGVDPTEQAGPALAVSARGWLLRGSRLALGLEAGFSRHPRFKLHQDYDRPDFGRQDSIDWHWRNYYRADGALTLRVRITPRWSLQVAAGAAWILSRPSGCEYVGVAGPGWGDCFDDRTPEYLHFNPRPVRPYWEIALAHDAPGAEAPGEGAGQGPADPRIDRTGLAPTARTLPPGTLTLFDEELFVVGVGYVLPQDAEIVARLLLPVVGFAALLTVKVPLLDAGRFRLAGYGAAGVVLGGSGVGVGAVGSVCLDRSCESLASAWALVGPAGNGALALFGPNLLLAFTPRFKAVVEIDLASNALQDPLALFALRIFGSSFALDGGVLLVENRVLPIGSLTWRPSRKR